MAWNEPDNNDEPPRTRRPQQGRPGGENPFLELKRRLETMLRSGGLGSETPPPRGEGTGSDGNGSLVTVIGVALLALWIASGVFQVEAS